MKKTAALLALFLSSCTLTPYRFSVTASVGQQIRRSTEQGERQLVMLAQESLQEDAWLYHNGKWTDIGIPIGQWYSGIHFGVLKPSYKKEAIFYHIHPGLNGISPPSALDLNALLLLRQQLPQSTVNARVCDGPGVWQYDISSYAIPSFFPDINPELATMYESAIMRTTESPLPLEKKVDSIIMHARGLGVHLEYVPLD